MNEKIELATYSSGKAEVPLVVLPGGPGFSSNIYRKYLSPLSEKTQVIFWDYRGTGSSPQNHEISFSHDVSDLNSIFLKTKASQVDLLAHSYGGAVALEFALKFPGSVRNLFFVSTTANFESVCKDMTARLAQKLNPETFAELVKSLGGLQGGRNVELEKQFCFCLAQAHLHRSSKNTIEEFSKISDFNSKVYYNNLSWVTLNFESKLKNISAKTFVLCGAHDIVIPQSFSKSLSEIKGAEFHVFPNSGHWPFIEEPNSFLEKIFELLHS